MQSNIAALQDQLTKLDESTQSIIDQNTSQQRNIDVRHSFTRVCHHARLSVSKFVLPMYVTVVVTWWEVRKIDLEASQSVLIAFRVAIYL